MPTLDRSRFAPAGGVRRGAYVLADPSDGGDPQVILIATGSEVGLAIEAYEQLTAEDVRARVVSMPSWELFAAQPTTYREAVLPPAIGARLAVEAGASLGWERWTGPAGGIVALDRFGASAPGEVNLRELGFTVEHVVARARALLAR
jgi:transketolase